MSGKLTFTPVGDLEIHMTRRFDATADRLFAAFTDASMLRKWIASPGVKVIECSSDPKPGGKYRFLIEGAKGERVGMGGTYREVVPNTRLVRTEVHDGYPVEIVSVFTFADHGPETWLSVTFTYPSKEKRDGMSAGGGLEHGIGESYDRIENSLRGG